MISDFRSSASSDIVRNLSTEKGRSSRPVRTWRKKTGPGLVALIRMALTRKNGDTTSRIADDTTRSNVRLRNRDPADSEAGAMSIMGSPDRSSTCERPVISSE